VRQVLAPFKAGERSLSYDSCYDWENWRSRSVTIEVTAALVVEGIGIFHPELQPFLDFRIWLDVDLQTSTRRGIERDLAAGQTSTQAWTDIWAPNDADYSVRYHPKDQADLVVRWLGPPGRGPG
jgi:uridine kinase